MPPNPSTTLSPRVPGASGLVSVQDDILHGLNDVIGALTGRTATPITILGQFKYSFGTPGASKVLTSDANGNATWQTGIAGAATSLSNTADATINADSDASGGGIIAFQIAGAQKASIEQNGYLKLGAGLDLNGQAIISSGLTTGQVLRATSATATGWGALSLSTAAAITGTLPVGNGGTGATTFTANYLLKGNTASALSSSVAYDDGTNIGIGTAVPEDLLHVQKAGALSQIILGKNQVSGYSAIQLRGAAATYNWIIGQQYNLGSGLEFTPSTLVEGTVFTTPALVIVSPTNYVGIGLNSPATLLHTKGAGVAVSGTNANAIIEDSTVFVATPGEGGTLILRGVYQTVGAGGAAASFGAIKGYKENATDDNYASALGFYTRANGGNLTKQVTIASDGNVTLTGSLGLTGTRISKGWFTDLEVTNAIVGSITGNAATVTGLTVTAGKTLTAQNTLTLSATDGSTLAIGTGGTLGTAAYTAATAYEAAGGIATHAALTTGVHGLDAKAPLASPTFIGTVTIPTPFTLGAVSVTATGAELNFLVGVSSAIQTQLDSKVSAALPWSISQSTTGRGTVTTDGIAVTVTGTNTFFLVDLNPGETITINGVTRTIAAITSNTSMTTTVAFGANTNQAYTIPGGVKFTFQGNTALGIGTTTPATIPGYAATQTGPSVQMYAANGAARWIVATAGATNAEHPQFIWRHGGCTDGDRNYRLTVNMHTVGTSDGISNLTLDQPVDDFSSNQHLMTWTKDGNVGIGATAPAYKLEVSGSFGSTSVYSTGRVESNKTANDTISVTNCHFWFGEATPLNAGLLGQQQASSPYTFTLQAQDYTQASSWFPLSLNPNGGNVGIRTKAPDATLEVNLGTSGQFRLSYNDSDGSAANYAKAEVSSAGLLTITTVDAAAAAGHIALMPDGNVGIGRTPEATAKLDVLTTGHFGTAGLNPALGDMIWLSPTSQLFTASAINGALDRYYNLFVGDYSLDASTNHCSVASIGGLATAGALDVIAVTGIMAKNAAGHTGNTFAANFMNTASGGATSGMWGVEIDLNMTGTATVTDSRILHLTGIFDADDCSYGLLINDSHASDWATATSYAVNWKVRQGGVKYNCLVAHTSGVFATDLAAGKWTASNVYWISNGIVIFDAANGIVIADPLTTCIECRASVSGSYSLIAGTGTDLSFKGPLNIVNYYGTSSAVYWRTGTSGSYTDRMVLDSAGRLGIGVTPKAWSSYSLIQVGSQAAFFGITAAAAGAGTLVGNNVYWDDVDERWEYITAGANDEASLYEQSNGAHIFYVTSTAGAANAAISWTEAMRITNGADVGIRCTPSNDSDLDVRGESGATALVRIDQIGTDAYCGYVMARDQTQKWFLGMDGTNDNFLIRRASSSNDVVVNTSGSVGIGTTPPAWSGLTALAWAAAAVADDTVGTAVFVNNGYYDGANWRARVGASTAACFILLSGGTLSVRGAAAVTGGSAQTFNDLLTIAANGNTVVTGTLTVNGDQTGATDHVFDSYDDLALLQAWRNGRPLPFATGDLLNRDRLLRDSIVGLHARIADLEAKLARLGA